MVLFSTLMDDLRENIDHNKNILQLILNKDPNKAYQKINEISLFTGSRYKVNLQLHFPDSKKISHIESFGIGEMEIFCLKKKKNLGKKKKLLFFRRIYKYIFIYIYIYLYFIFSS